MSREDKFLFYQLNPLKRLKEQKPKDKGIKEKHIENLFCQNLENIFFGWISLNQQKHLDHPEKDEENCIVDSLAFNKNSKNFLIIEYKREKAAELVYQVEKYIECLEDEEKGVCIRNRNKLVDILNDNESIKKTKGIWKEEEIKWDETKAICIITEIHGYQKILKRKPREKIHILEIKFYEENFLSIDCEKLPDWIVIEKKQKTAPQTSYKEDKNKLNYAQTIEEIAELEWMNSTVKQWLIEVDSLFSIFSQNNPLIREVNAKNENYYPVVNYKSEGKIVISVVIKVSQINVYWNFKEKPSDNLLKLLNRYQVEYKEKNHRGTGNWHFPLIISDGSCRNLANFIQELRNFYKL